MLGLSVINIGSYAGGAELGMIVSLGVKLVISGGSLGMGWEVTREGCVEGVVWGTKGTHSWGPRATHSWVTEATHEWVVGGAMNGGLS